jgi:hypothetical protein
MTMAIAANFPTRKFDLLFCRSAHFWKSSPASLSCCKFQKSPTRHARGYRTMLTVLANEYMRLQEHIAR